MKYIADAGSASRFFLLIIFFSTSIWAQSPQEEIFRHPLRPETLSAFTLTCGRLAEHPLVKGNFEQEKILSRLNRSLKSSGNFIIAGEAGMVWETIQPFPSTLSLGKDFLIQSRPGGQKTVINAQGNETFIRLAEILSAVFSGRSQGLLDNFEIYFLESIGASGAVSWELGLVPLDKAIASFALTITMKGDSAIRSIIIHEQNGDSISYVLSDHNYPAELNTHEKAFFTLP